MDLSSQIDDTIFSIASWAELTGHSRGMDVIEASQVPITVFTNASPDIQRVLLLIHEEAHALELGWCQKFGVGRCQGALVDVCVCVTYGCVSV